MNEIRMEEIKRKKRRPGRRKFTRRVMDTYKNRRKGNEPESSNGQAQSNGRGNTCCTFARRKTHIGTDTNVIHLLKAPAILEYIKQNEARYGKKITWHTKQANRQLDYFAKHKGLPITLVKGKLYSRSDLLDEWLAKV